MRTRSAGPIHPRFAASTKSKPMPSAVTAPPTIAKPRGPRSCHRSTSSPAVARVRGGGAAGCAGARAGAVAAGVGTSGDRAAGRNDGGGHTDGWSTATGVGSAASASCATARERARTSVSSSRSPSIRRSIESSRLESPLPVSSCALMLCPPRVLASCSESSACRVRPDPGEPRFAAGVAPDLCRAAQSVPRRANRLLTPLFGGCSSRYGPPRAAHSGNRPKGQTTHA